MGLEPTTTGITLRALDRAYMRVAAELACRAANAVSVGHCNQVAQLGSPQPKRIVSTISRVFSLRSAMICWTKA